MSTQNELEKLLPSLSFAVNAVTGKPIVIKRFECGYYEAPDSVTDADAENARLGVSKLQARAMLNGSMFGWHVPAADPRNLAEE